MPAPQEPGSNPDRDAMDDFLKGFSPERPRFEDADSGDTDGEPSDGELAQRALRRALGDFSLTCPECDGICDAHAIKIRDRVLIRAASLADRFVKGCALYLQQRDWGVQEPEELLTRLFAVWEELTFLGQASEPQNDLPDVEDPEADEE